MAKSKKPFRPKARRPRGFEDRPADIYKAERDLIASAGAVYEAHGFEPLATSAFEYADALGKFLPDEERPNEGVFALQDDDEQWMALRYDLTAPLARFAAENFQDLTKPYRRWAAGPVWRNEKPGPGRFREFWQCDADTVGAPGAEADAEMVMLAVKVMQAAGLSDGDFVIRVNDRRLLDGVLEKISVTDETTKGRILRAIDKIDRLGRFGVEFLLQEGREDESGDFTAGAGLNDDQSKVIFDFVELTASLESADRSQAAENADKLEQLQSLVGETLSGATAIENLNTIKAILDSLGLTKREWSIDTAVVRGLGYYTGPVFEADLLKTATYEDGQPIRFGSVGGGGRYDDLVSRFTGQAVPATGFSFGVSRFAAALRALQASEQTVFDGPVVILALEPDQTGAYFAMADEIRNTLGVAAEVYVGGSKNFGKQLKYADKRRAPAAVIMGQDEREAGQVTVKDLALGARLAAQAGSREDWLAQEQQETVARGDLVQAIRRALERS